jgi:hypothetical protein
LGCLDSSQGTQVVEAPRGPDIELVQDGWIFELNLLDVVIEIQRYQGLHGSGVNKLGLQKLDGLSRPRAHGVGICVIHILAGL